MCARYGTSFDFNTPITENTTFTADWLDPATIGCPQLKIGEDNLWYVSYDDGKTWTSLGVKATGATGEKDDKGDKGDKGDHGLIPYIGVNGNWWIGELDTGVNAAASFEAASPVTIVIGAAAGLALAGNIALALTLRRVLKKKELV